MEFQKKWINWAIESNNTEILNETGSKCYMDNEWVKTLPVYKGKKTNEGILSFLMENFKEFTYTSTSRGFISNMNNTDCFCPLIKEKITNNPKLCDCTKAFHKNMYEKILRMPVEAEVVESVLRDKTSCIFEIIITFIPLNKEDSRKRIEATIVNPDTMEEES